MNTKIVELYSRLNQAMEQKSRGKLERALLEESCRLLLEKMNENEALEADEAIGSVDLAAKRQLEGTVSGSAEEEAVLKFVELTARLAVSIFREQRVLGATCWGAKTFLVPSCAVSEELYVH